MIYITNADEHLGDLESKAGTHSIPAPQESSSETKPQQQKPRYPREFRNQTQPTVVQTNQFKCVF